VHVQALLEKHFPEHGNVAEHRNVYRREGSGNFGRQRFARQALAEKARNAGTEDREHEAGDYLVSPEGYRNDGIDQRAGRPRRTGCKDGDDGIGRRERRREADGSAEEHHSLDSQVEVADLFAQDAAEGGKQDVGAHLHGGLQEEGEGFNEQVHFAASPETMYGRICNGRKSRFPARRI